MDVQVIVEGIRKVVVLVLLMELVLQMQSGKQYESYIKMLVGVMVIYSLVVGIFGAFSGFESVLKPMEEMQWTGEWLWKFEKQAEELVEENGYGSYEMEENLKEDWNIQVQTNISPVPEIVIEEVVLEEVHITGNVP